MKDLTGKKYGKWTVEHFSFRKGNGYYWLCRCECGKTKNVRSADLKNGKSKSCGCFQREWAKKTHTVHGLYHTRLYKIYAEMKARCLNKNDKSYFNYGGRGIKICDEWLNDFKLFYDWSISNGYDKDAPRGECTIERIDVNGNYEPSNCKWISSEQQALNKRNSIRLTYNNSKKTLKELSRVLGIRYGTLLYRFHRYKNIKDIFSKEEKNVELVNG